MLTLIAIATIFNMCIMPPISFAPGTESLIDSYQPVSDKDIRDFEQKIGFTLPEDYRAFLLQRNGGWFCHDEVCPLKDPRGYQGEKLIDLDSLDSLSTDNVGLEYRRNNYGGQLPPDMLVIGTAAMGDGLVVPLTGKRRGAVLLFDHEGSGEWNERLYLIADSFETFMHSIKSQPEVTEALPLFQAAQTADFVALERLLQAGESLETRNERGETPLMCAAGWRQPRVVEFLLKRGADMHAQDISSKTVLIHAARGGSVDCVGLVLEAGANINSQDEDGQSALTRAIGSLYTRAALYLIEHGADVHVRDKSGKTTLIHAAKWNLSGLSRRLLEAGVDVNAQDKEGESALTASIRPSGGNVTSIYLIEQGADIHVQTKRGETPLSMAKYANLKELLKQRLNESR
ncbi:MAG: ankyrin repeat domain-containing protein [Pirellulales bacterium]|nr:ankyrin repeat domain-containing protein [Pirellulales bacterium]